MRVENKKRFIAFCRKSLKMKFVLVFRCWPLRVVHPCYVPVQASALVHPCHDTP